MPDLDYYVMLLEDRARIEAFLASIARTVKPGDRVVEIGCGVGTYAMGAARAGAAHVDAVDFNAMAISLARELGVDRDGRIKLVEAPAEQVATDPADVVIFEDMGAFFFTPGLRGLFEHVRRRVAKPGARYVPEALELFAAPTDAPPPLAGDCAYLPFSADAVALLRKRSRNWPASIKVEPSALLGPTCRLARIPLDQPVPRRAVYSGTTVCARSAAATGLLAWTRLLLPGGRAVDNAPGQGGIWRHVFFPFEEPLPCASGATVEHSIEVATGPGPKGLIWRWTARVAGGGARQGCSVNALPGDLDTLRRGSPDYVPRPAARREALAEICRLIDGRRSVLEIARTVYTKYASLFAGEPEALDFVFGALDSAAGLIEDRTK